MSQETLDAIRRIVDRELPHTLSELYAFPYYEGREMLEELASLAQEIADQYFYDETEEI